MAKLSKDTIRRIDVYNLLRELNFNISSKGFDYWLEAIMMNEQSLMVIYEELAKRYNTSYTNIERCMRTAKQNAIENIQKRCRLDIPLSNIMILRLLRNEMEVKYE